MRVAVLGTGIMGAPIARNIASAGHDVVVWNRTPKKAENLGLPVSESPAEAVGGADAVVTMLAAGDAVREVMTGGALDAFGSDAIWLQMSTVGLRAIEELTGLADNAGVTMVDCPVLGTKQPAQEAKLVVLAAGPSAVREPAEEIFAAIGQRTLWLGDQPGPATRMKLVVNNWVVGVTEVLAESIALARKLDVDPAKFLEVLDGNPVGSPYAQLKGKMMLDESFEPSFPLRLALKDAKLVLEAAQDDLQLAAARATVAQMERAAELGHADEDMAATYYASLSRNSGDAAA